MEPTLFKKENNARAEELKRYIALNINTHFDTLGPALAMAERTYLDPVLGKDLTAKLAQYYNGELEGELTAEASAAWAELLSCAQGAVAKIAYSKSYDEISVILDDRGARAGASENRLYRYQEKNLKRSLLRQGYDLIDKALETAEGNPETFPEYGNSPWRRQLAGSLIKTTADFNKYYNIENSRLVFIRMIRHLKDVEQTALIHHIGRETLEEMAAHPEEGRWKALEFTIKSYLVNKAVAESVTELKKTPTEKGLIYETSQQDGWNENQTGRYDMSDTIALHTRRADAYIVQAVNFLNANIGQYPEYERHTAGRATGRRYHRDNKGKKTFVL